MYSLVDLFNNSIFFFVVEFFEKFILTKQFKNKHTAHLLSRQTPFCMCGFLFAHIRIMDAPVLDRPKVPSAGRRSTRMNYEHPDVGSTSVISLKRGRRLPV